MKILKSAGTFEVLTKPENVIRDIATAARTCYQSQDKANPENDIKLVKNLITRGHTPMLEFADLTVRFNGVSRGFTHEMVRHRLASYAQESTRYVDESDFEVVVPPHKDETLGIDVTALRDLDHTNNGISLEEWLMYNEEMYRSLRRDGWKPEDARQILPTAIKAQIVVKADISEWRHIFFRRCDKFAHWEIRVVMLELLKWCQQNIPVVFDDYYYFQTDGGIQYSRKVLSKAALLEEIDHYRRATGDMEVL